MDQGVCDTGVCPPARRAGQARPLHPTRRKQLKYLGLGAFDRAGAWRGQTQYGVDYWAGRPVSKSRPTMPYVQADNTLIAPRIRRISVPRCR